MISPALGLWACRLPFDEENGFCFFSANGFREDRFVEVVVLSGFLEVLTLNYLRVYIFEVFSNLLPKALDFWLMLLIFWDSHTFRLRPEPVGGGSDGFI